MTKKMHLSIDIETLDTKHSAAVVEVGAIAFTLDEIVNNSCRHRYLTVLSYFQHNIPPRHFNTHTSKDTVSMATLTWWANASGRDLHNLPGNNSVLTLAEHKEEVRKCLARLGATGDYYTRGQFDMPILANFLSLPELSADFRKFADVRTLDKIVKFPKLANAHHALADAMHNIHIIAAVNRLTIRYNPECSHLENLCSLTTSMQSEIPKAHGLATGGQLSLL